jgi:N-acetylneuraminic acid mutarotase/(2Fe-2S) ferredoxin
MIVLGLLATTYFRSSAFSPNSQSSPLSFAERVNYERELQAVYFKHRLYSETNQQRKPTLDEILPLDTTRIKVEDLLRKENALEQSLNIKITPEMLQAEIERMSRESRQPEVLRELFAALENNPYLIAECLARPILVGRLTSQRADFEDWWAKESGNFSIEITRQDFNYSLPESSVGGSSIDDTWKPLPTLPDGATEHTIVWTGTEMLVWGGVVPASGASKTNAGSRYNPATDSWFPITGSGAPSPRRTHTAVWTGTEMIVWGGCGTSHHFCGASSGGRYNPATDSWLPTSMTDVPNPRLDHTAVWTGDRMIVFGGCTPNADFTNCPSRKDGAMYFPATDSWVAITDGASLRRNHTAVWTGAEMLIWGGMSNVGERFNPNTNSWMTMNAANAPESRERQTAVWTGTEMIVWGGSVTSYIKLNTGGRYNPSSDSWTSINTANAPEARYLHTGIWTGTEMIIWGGNTATLGENFLNTGGKYDPANDTWTSTNTLIAPLAREQHKAIWTGSEMILWGGRRDVNGSKTGSRYNPATDSWIVMGANESASNTDAEAVWTGAEMIIWGGAFTNGGTKYDPATSTWSPIANATGLEQRDRGFKLIWTGTEMIVWGGQTGNVVLDTGGRYNPATDSWTMTSMANAPVERAYHTAVWTGSEMIIWGGSSEVLLNNGGRYNPSTNSWAPVSTTGAPAARYLHSAVFVAGKMVVWSGSGGSGFVNTGGRYEPSTNSWQPVSTVNAPEPRMNHTAISTGTEMIVWGGNQQFGAPFLNTGGRYDPATDLWTPTSLTNAPVPRAFHTSVWTGTEMIIWGGSITDSLVGSNTGGRYNPATNLWRATNTSRAGTERSDHVAVWTGNSMMIWGGNVRAGSGRAGYEYFANANARTLFDFDGDGRADVSVFRPSDTVWYLLRSQNGFTAAQFGISTDKITPADFDGDGKTDIAVYRNGTWYILRSSNAQVSILQFGLAEDTPLPSDFDGDGRADLVVFRPSDNTWYRMSSANGATSNKVFALAGDRPVSGDFDGDGKSDVAIFRPSTGDWWWQSSIDNAQRAARWGISTDVPVCGDYDADGKTDFAVYRDGIWYVMRSRDGVLITQFGLADDIPTPADYDGDGKADLAVYRQGVWYIWRSSDNNYTIVQFGLATDIPIPSPYTR